jgi:hypothetical protein
MSIPPEAALLMESAGGVTQAINQPLVITTEMERPILLSIERALGPGMSIPRVEALLMDLVGEVIQAINPFREIMTEMERPTPLSIERMQASGMFTLPEADLLMAWGSAGMLLTSPW